MQTDQLGHSTIEQHMSNIGYLRNLYALAFIIVLAGWVLSSFSLYYFDSMGKNIAEHYIIGIIIVIIAVILVIVAIFVY
jgi:hypothetical protein